MSTRIRSYAVVLGTAALVGGSGLGIAQAQESSGDSSSDRPARGERPGHGPGRANLSALAAKLGVSTDRLAAAMRAVRPERPARGRRGPGDDRFAAALASALGVETAQVRTILDANRPTSRPRRGSRPNRSALVTALAGGLDKSEADVRAALDQVDAARRAEHDAREARMAAALAEELGLSTETVAAALDETRPARPPKPSA